MGSGRTKTKKQRRRRGRATTGTKLARLPRTFDARTTTADSLDTLLHERYHGAVNIRGIRFQVRYAMLRAVEMAHAVRTAKPPTRASVATSVADSVHALPPAIVDASTDSLHQPLLRMEGIEDVDVADPSLGPLRVLGQQTQAGGECVQVKTGASPWNWAKLKEPLIGWVEPYRTAAAGIAFGLVVNFEPIGDLALLAGLPRSNLPPPSFTCAVLATCSARCPPCPWTVSVD